MSPIWGGVYESIANGNLGLPPTSPVGTILAVGPCSLGDDDTVYIFGKADAKALREELGYGDLVDRLHDFFSVSGNKAKAIVVPANKDAAGENGDVTHTGTGAAVATTGESPTATFDIVVEILTGGDFGTATFRYSLDGGDTWSGPITTPAASATPYAFPNAGSTIIWTDAAPGPTTFVAGDTFTFSTIGPSCTLTAILSALNAGVDSHLPFEYACVFTDAASATWTGLGTWADNLFANEHIAVRVLTEAPFSDLTDDKATYLADLIAEIAGFAHDRVSVCAGLLEVQDIHGASFLRGKSGLVAGLIAGSPVQRSIGATAYGRLFGVMGDPYEMTAAERKSLDELRYIVARQYPGLPGWYINNGNVATSNGSDFQTIELCRVMDNVIRVARNEALKHVHSIVNIVDGVADPAGLAAFQGAVQNAINGQKETFSACKFEIPEGQDVLATSSIDANVKLVPKGYMKEINITFGLYKTID